MENEYISESVSDIRRDAIDARQVLYGEPSGESSVEYFGKSSGESSEHPVRVHLRGIELLEATSAYLRDALEQIALALGLTINADYGPKPNGVLLDDILRHIEG